MILHDEGYQQVQGHTESTVQAGAGITVVSGSELNDYLTNTNSGSGSGLPLLVQRSVARQVFMLLLCTYLQILEGAIKEFWGLGANLLKVSKSRNFFLEFSILPKNE